ncbi:MAG: hypothetical protein Q9217_005007 [Psora testacea]
MPSFHNTTLSQCMPLTPPEAYGPYPDSGYGFGPLSSMQSVTNEMQDPYYEVSLREGFATGKHHSQYPPTAASRHIYQATLNGTVAPTYPLPTSSSSNHYGPITASLLPPIRVPDRSSGEFNRQLESKRAPTIAPTKEEKVGGVAAHLDYEMDEMIDFVSEMAQGMYDLFYSKLCLADIDVIRSVLNSKSSPPRDFRKYVSQVLCSTRLPSSTILLGLLYMSKRMILLSNKGRYGQGTRDIYSMLTTALMLGSKFLDDNTFQNRSWSEVSNIPVSNLNFLEIQWLVDINWDMHIDQSDTQGFRLWFIHWKRFQTRKIDMSLAESMRQTHIDSTGQQRSKQRPEPQLPPLNTQQFHPQPDRRSRDSSGCQNHGPWNTPHHARWQIPGPQTNYSPTSAPETGPNTPDACSLLDAYRYAPPPVHPTFKLPPAPQMLPSNASLPGYPTPYVQQYTHYSHGNYCECSFCNPYSEPYFMSPGYRPQLVAA